MKTQDNFDNLTKENLITLLKEMNILSAQQSKQIQFLEEQILAYQLRQFAAKSEKINPNQASLFDEAELAKSEEKILAQEEEITVASYKRKNKVGRKALPSELLRVPRIYDLTEKEKICACGCELTHIKDEKSEQLEIIPAKIYVIEHTRKKYACKNCQMTIKLAKQPLAPIPRSIAASGLLSHVLVSKFQDHLPLHRQETILRRIGVDIPRATLSLWVIKCAELFFPLLKLMHDRILTYDVAYADETTTQVLKEPNKGVQSKKYMWMFAGGPPDEFVYFYRYHPSRSHEVALDFFEDFAGFVHCDGYPAYDSLASKNPGIILVGCLYHARRKFVEVAKLMPNKEGVAAHAINLIAKIAHVEEEIKNFSLFEKQAARLSKAKPLLEELHQYLINNQPTIPPKCLLGQAVSYTLNQWRKIINYLKDPRLDISNNLSERAIKPFVIGRKGWLFANSVAGANAAAIIFSIIETCKHHKVEPYEYLRYVLNILPQCQTIDDYEKLLPYKIDRSLLAPSVN
ncbi:MAG: IS66 family transposase [Gammaproteobacteria bacterium]